MYRNPARDDARGRLVILLIFCLCFAACQGGPAADTPAVLAAATEAPAAAATAPAATTAPTATAVPTATATAAPTATPEERRLRYIGFYGGNTDRAWHSGTVANYQALNPDLNLNFLSGNFYSSPVPNSLYLFLDGGNPPDVMTGFPAGHMRHYIQTGQIADITHLWEANNWDAVFPASLKEMASYEGRQYFVPQALQWNSVWYRTDIFAAAGLTVPETWDDLLAACDTLHAAGYIPIAVATSGWTAPVARWFTHINLRLNGPDFHEALMSGQVSFQDDRVRAVFEYWAEMFAHNCFRPDLTSYRDAAQQIFAGEAAMYDLGEWLSESYSDGFPDTFDFFTVPVINPDVPRAEVVHVYAAFMLSDARQPAEAEAFLAYLAGAESQSGIVSAVGRVTANLEVDVAPLGDVYERGRQFIVDAEHITPLFEFVTAPDLAGAGLNAFVEFYMDPADIDTVLARLEAARALAYGPLP